MVYFVFYDGELAQIAQGQQIPYNRKTCTILGKISLQGVADAVGARYLHLKSNEHIDTMIADALKLAADHAPVIVDVKIDYSKPTRFTQGVVKAVSSHLPLGEKARFIGRALWRKGDRIGRHCFSSDIKKMKRPTHQIDNVLESN